MTYSTESIDQNWIEVGRIPHQVPTTDDPDAIDEDVDCWVITLATKRLSCVPFQIQWWNSGKNAATGMGSVLEAFPHCVILSWEHLNDLPDKF